LKWLIVAGGTGGHIIPGIAIAQELIKNAKRSIFYFWDKENRGGKF